MFLAIGIAIAALAIAANLATSGIGPFTARVVGQSVGASAGTIVTTIEIRNDGRTTGSATCRVTDPRDATSLHSAVIYSPRVAAGATVTFEQEIAFVRGDRPLSVSCEGP